MTIYILRKTLSFTLTLFTLSLISFLLFTLTPGDPALLIAKERMGGELPTPEVFEKIKKELNLDAPLFIIYIDWLKRYLKGDWGRSFVTNQPVLSLIMDRFKMTLLLALTSFIISFPLSLISGILAGIRKGSKIDYAISIISMVLDSIPALFLGLNLMMIFGVKLHLLPVAGSSSIKNIALPAITLSAGYIAATSRITRASVIETLSKDYIITARAKGIGKSLILKKHVLRNSLVPVVTYAGIELAWLLEGSVIVETLFSWPGIGSLLAEATLAKDLPIIQGCLILFGLIFLTISGSTELIHMLINPEVRAKSE